MDFRIFTEPQQGASYDELLAVALRTEQLGFDGFFRSDNGGGSWVRINDDKHQFGFTGQIIGDPRVFGRAYVGSGGRGILYGEPK